MSQRPQLTLQFFDFQGQGPMALVDNPRKCIIKSGFGAMTRRCWIELFNEDLDIPVHLGDVLAVFVNGVPCFRGRIQQRRIDSSDDHLSLYAENKPQHEWNYSVYGTFENQTITGILKGVLMESKLVRGDGFERETVLRKVVFSGESLFAAIDLLAKLAGNWEWYVSDEGVLFFHPPKEAPDHWMALRRDVDGVNLWETTTDVYAQVEIDGGKEDGVSYLWIIDILGQTNVPEDTCVRVYMRSTATPDVIVALSQAVVRQMAAPHYEHYVDFMGRGESISPGDSIRFHVENLSLFPQNQLFRIKMREMTYAHESLQVRLHLTSGFESSETYFHYFHIERPLPPVGPFQMDVSALDSIAYLDGISG